MSDKPAYSNRPHTQALPEPVRAGMENVAAAIFFAPRTNDWRYQKKQ